MTDEPGVTRPVTVGAREIRAAVPMAEAIDAVRRGFVDLAGGAFEMPTRTVLGDGRFLVMSAHHRPTSSAMIKTLSLDFERRPAIAGTVVWSETGSLSQLVADAAAVTTLRTGAAVGVATDLLAPPDAGRLTIIGAGAQAPDQVRAVHAVRPLRHLTVVDHHHGRAEALVDALRPELGDAELRVSADPEPAVRDAEIVCCATTATRPLFAGKALPERVHVNAIGAFRPTMRELPDELLASATVVVDELAAILEESGEIIHAIETGAITQDALTELGVALTSGADHGPRTVFKTVGVAVQDWVIARLLAGKFLP
jgi:ornithine cyclodeaminase